MAGAGVGIEMASIGNDLAGDSVVGPEVDVNHDEAAGV